MLRCLSILACCTLFISLASVARAEEASLTLDKPTNWETVSRWIADEDHRKTRAVWDRIQVAPKDAVHVLPALIKHHDNSWNMRSLPLVLQQISDDHLIGVWDQNHEVGKQVLSEMARRFGAPAEDRETHTHQWNQQFVDRLLNAISQNRTRFECLNVLQLEPALSIPLCTQQIDAVIDCLADETVGRYKRCSPNLTVRTHAQSYLAKTIQRCESRIVGMMQGTSHDAHVNAIRILSLRPQYLAKHLDHLLDLRTHEAIRLELTKLAIQLPASDPRVSEMLWDHFTNGDEQLQVAAGQALASILAKEDLAKREATIGLLVRHATVAPFDRRSEVIVSAIPRLKPTEVDAVVDAMVPMLRKDRKHQAFRVLVRAGNVAAKAIPEMEAAIAGEPLKQQMQMATQLIKIDGNFDSRCHFYQQGLRAKEPEVLKYALYQIRLVGEPAQALVSQIEPFTGEQHSIKIRTAAASALGEIGIASEQARQNLKAMLTAEASAARYNAKRALAKLER